MIIAEWIVPNRKKYTLKNPSSRPNHWSVRIQEIMSRPGEWFTFEYFNDVSMYNTKSKVKKKLPNENFEMETEIEKNKKRFLFKIRYIGE